MPDLDRYVKAIQDLLAPLGSPAERLSAVDQAMQRIAPQDARRATGELISGLAAMPERLRDLQRVLGDFASPAPQLRSFQEQLATTRQQLQLMATQLEAAEAMVGRVADLAEQLASFQQPFLDAAAAWRGDNAKRDA